MAPTMMLKNGKNYRANWDHDFANFEGPFYEVPIFRGRCQDHVFTMLKPHLAYIYFQMS